MIFRAALIAPVVALFCQVRPEAFEVASIKASDPLSRRISFGFTPNGGLNVQNLDLQSLAGQAWNIPCGFKGDCSRVIGATGWMRTDRFDITARPAAGEVSDAANKEKGRLRLRALLAERFHLVAHQETREMPVYYLTLAKNGHKLTPSARTDDSGRFGASGEMVAENIDLAVLVTNLANILGRPVIDKTGLTGRYDFRLNFTADGPLGQKTEAADPSADAGPSIFTALQEQLGLRLEAAKAPVEVLVVERAERPDSN